MRLKRVLWLGVSLVWSGCLPGLPLDPSTSTLGGLTAAALTVNKIGTGSGTSVTLTAPKGTAYTTVTIDEGSQFLATNVCNSVTIFGLAGSASCAVSGSTAVVSLSSILQSTANRTVGTTQLTQAQETTTYANQSLPSGYREVPVVATDDDGSCTADTVTLGACSAPVSAIKSITYSQHMALVSCGSLQTTVAARLADCQSKNPSVATWSGATNGTSGEADWKLITRLSPDITSGACTLSGGATALPCVFKEVWQDQRTQYLWSSLVAGAQNNGGTATGGGMAATNWCKAAGNIENSGGTNCSPGGANQPASAVSFCTEILQPAISGETWIANTPGNYVYDNAKGGMGRYSSPSVRWRLPTISDYKQADLDGIRFVMPDMGAISGGGVTPLSEWSATLDSNTRTDAMYFGVYFGDISTDLRTNLNVVRCVSR